MHQWKQVPAAIKKHGFWYVFKDLTIGLGCSICKHSINGKRGKCSPWCGF